MKKYFCNIQIFLHRIILIISKNQIGQSLLWIINDKTMIMTRLMREYLQPALQTVGVKKHKIKISLKEIMKIHTLRVYYGV